eukprot:g2428.t1
MSSSSSSPPSEKSPRKSDETVSKGGENADDTASNEVARAHLHQARRADTAIGNLVKSLSDVQSAVEVIRGCSSFAAIVSQQQKTISHLEKMLEDAREKSLLQNTLLKDVEKQRDKLQQQIPVLQRDADRHKTKSIGEMKRSERLATECSTLRQLNADHQKQISSLQGKLGDSMDRQNDLQQVLQKTLHSLERERNEVSRLTDTVLRHKQTIQTLRKEKSDVLRNFQSMSERLHEEAKGFVVDTVPLATHRSGVVASFRSTVAAAHSSGEEGKKTEIVRPLSTRRTSAPVQAVKIKNRHTSKKKVDDWDSRDVVRWFESLELNQYSDACRALRLTGKKIRKLTDPEFLKRKLQVEAELHRRKIIKNASRLLGGK